MGLFDISSMWDSNVYNGVVYLVLKPGIGAVCALFRTGYSIFSSSALFSDQVISALSIVKNYYLSINGILADEWNSGVSDLLKLGKFSTVWP